MLIAEDNPVNQQVLPRQVQRLGLVADAVDNGQEALDALAQENYDAVLMDCQMPVMDGYAATRAIRAAEAAGGPRLPIVAVTANAMREDYDRCRESGMDDFVAKPVTLAALAQRSSVPSRASRGAARRSEARAKTLSSGRTAPAATTGLRSTAGARLAAGGRWRRPSALLRIVRLFLEQLDPQAEQIDATARRRRARDARAQRPPDEVERRDARRERAGRGARPRSRRPPTRATPPRSKSSAGDPRARRRKRPHAFEGVDGRPGGAASEQRAARRRVDPRLDRVRPSAVLRKRGALPKRKGLSRPPRPGPQR